MKKKKKRKVEITFIVKRVWTLEKDETIEHLRGLLEDEGGEYLYGGAGVDESLVIKVRELK